MTMLRYICYVFLGFLGVSVAYAQDWTTIPTGHTDLNADIKDKLLATDPADKKMFDLRGHAQRLGPFCYQLDDAAGQGGNGSGRFWWPDKLPLNQNFRLQFLLYAGTDDSGGEGITFIMHNSSNGLGATGTNSSGGLGALGIDNSLAIEVDTYQNVFQNLGNNNCSLAGGSAADYARDPTSDHVALIGNNGLTGCPLEIQTTDATNTLDANQVRHASVFSNERNIEAGRCDTLTVVWDYSTSSQRIRLFVNDTLRLMREGNLISNHLGGATEVWWGFTSSVSGAQNKHVVCLPTSYANPQAEDDDVSAPAGATISIDILANDLANSEQTELFVTRILSSPSLSGAVASLGTDNQTIEYYLPSTHMSGTDQLTYEVCSTVDEDGCYAQCDQANVNITVGCPSDHTLVLIEESDNYSCTDELNTGAITANVVKVNPTGSLTYTENFSSASVTDVTGRTFQSDGKQSTWASTPVNATLIGRPNVQIGNFNNKYLHIPIPRLFLDRYYFDMRFVVPATVTSGSIQFKVGRVGGTNSTPVNLRIDTYRIDVNGNQLRVHQNHFVTSGLSPQTVDISLNSTDLGAVGGEYTIRFDINHRGSSAANTQYVPMWLDDIEFTMSPADTPVPQNDTYTFQWYEVAADDTQTEITGATDRVINQLDNGRYTATAKLAGGNCPLSPAEFVTIENLITTDVITVTEHKPVTSCVDSDGDLRAVVTNESGDNYTLRYDIVWYESTQLTTPVHIGGDFPIAAAISYEVRATHKNTGCLLVGSITASSMLVTPPKPYIVEIQNAVSCLQGGTLRTGSSGHAQVAAVGSDELRGRFRWLQLCPNGDLSRYTYYRTGEFLRNVGPGCYTVWLESPQCRSDTIHVKIGNDALELGLGYTIVDNEFCTPPYNGRLAVIPKITINSGTPTVLDVDANLVLTDSNVITMRARYRNGPAIAQTSPSGHDGAYINYNVIERISRYGNSNFSFTVTHRASTCEVSIPVFPLSGRDPEAAVIDVAAVDVSDNASCLVPPAPAGRIDASAAATTLGVVSPDGYTYKIASNVLPAPFFVESGTGIFEGLVAGDYTLTATDDRTRCPESAAHTVRVLNANNIASITLDSQTPNTFCTSTNADGSVTITANTASGVTVANFQHEIFEGHNTIDPPKASETTTSATHTFTGLEAGPHRMRVTDVATACFQTYDILMSNDWFYPTYASPAANITGVTSCTVGDGAITLNLVDKAGDPIADPTAADANGRRYNFTWYEGSGILPPSTLLSDNTHTVTGLDSGPYTVSITGPNGCRTLGHRTFNVNASTVLIAVDIVEVQPVTACVQAEADGILRANIIRGGTEADFTFEWFQAAAPGTAGTGFATTSQIPNAWEGDYSVRVTHTSGCTAEASETITSARHAPRVSIVGTPTDNTACSAPFNGTAEIEVEYRGSSVTDFTGYTFELNGNTTTPTTSFTTLEATSPPGHELTVTRLGCVGSLRIQIGESRFVPNILDPNVTVTDSESCDEDAAPAGAIEVQPDGVTNGTGYTFAWYNQPYSATAPVIAGETDHQLSRLRSGTYAVKVTHDATRCESTRDFTIGLTPGTVPNVTFSVTNVTSCNPFNGETEATLAGGADAGDFTWEWFEGIDDTTPLTTGVSTAGQATSLAPGRYAVRYIETATACRSILYTDLDPAIDLEVEIPASLKPAFTIDNSELAGDCRGLRAEVQVHPTHPTGSTFNIYIYTGDHSDFSGLTTFREKTGIGPANQTFVDTNTPTKEKGLPAGFYTMRVQVQTTLCDSVATFPVNYANSPTVVSIRDFGPSNCAPYTNTAGNAGEGGASGWVRVELTVNVSGGALDHDGYQLFLYAAPNLSSPAAFNPLPSMAGGSRAWRVSDGRPRNIQRVAGSQTGGATGRQGPFSGAITPANKALSGPLGTVNTTDPDNPKRDYIFAGLSGNTDPSINNYLVVAAEEGQAACFSVPVPFNIPLGNDELEIPDPGDPGEAVVTNNMSCGGTGTGSIAINRINRMSRSGRATDFEVEDPGATPPSLLTDTYTFEWFNGNIISSPTLSALPGVSGPMASTLSSGIYTVRVTKNTPNDLDDHLCEAIFDFAVDNEGTTISIADADSTDLVSCVSPDGSITINDVDIGAGVVSFSGVGTDFEVTVRNSDNQDQLPNLTPGSLTKSNLEADQYTLILRNTVTGCQSPGFLQDVNDVRPIPRVNYSSTGVLAPAPIEASATTITPNVGCSDGNFNGGVEVGLFNTTLLFGTYVPPLLDFTWYLNGIPPAAGAEEITSAPLSNGSVATGSTTGRISGLNGGTYYALMVDADPMTLSGCQAEAAFVVPDEREIPNLAFDPSFVTHNTSCSTPNGEVSVTPGSITPFPPAVTYYVELFTDPNDPSSRVDSRAPLLYNAISVSYMGLSYLGEDDYYYLRVEHGNTGCSSSFARFQIENEFLIPQISRLSITNDRGCTGNLEKGEVEVRLLITDQDRALGHIYDVTVGTTTETGVSTEVVPLLTSLPSGELDIVIENTVNGCRYESKVNVGKDKPDFGISGLSTSHQTYCGLNANGVIRVEGLRFDGTTLEQPSGVVASVYTDFGFVWMDETGATRTSVHGYELDGLFAGNYDVGITHTMSGCVLGATFTVREETEDPLLQMRKIAPDSSCVPSEATGILMATADGEDHTYDGDSDGTYDYQFNWYEGIIGGADKGSTARAENLMGGQSYVVEVSNTITSCASDRAMQVESDPFTPIVNLQEEITYTDVTLCHTPNGGIQLTGVDPYNLYDYVIRFYDMDPEGSPAPSPLETVRDGNANFANLSLEDYYIQLEHQTYGCRSVAYQLTPTDGTERPDITLEDVLVQTYCDPDKPNGEMEISVGGVQDLALYDFEWRKSGEDNVFLANETRATGISAGDYTIKATNKGTGCSSEETFTLRDLVINPLELTFQSRGNSKCEAPYDGIIIADVEEKLPTKELSDYGFYWITGTEIPTADNAEYENSAWQELDSGVYTVVAYYEEDPMCVSVPTQFRVENIREIPVTEIQHTKLLTNCDPAIANAELRAIVPADSEYLQSFSFEWFEGSYMDPDFEDGEDKIRSTSSVYSNLRDTTYTVAATRVITGCRDTTSFTIEPAYSYPDPPILMLERSRTDCVNPNGVAYAEVEGDAFAYDFEWYAGNDLMTVLFTTPRVEELDAGVYYVHVVSKETGCRTQIPGEVIVFNAQREKRARIEALPSLCTENTGSATVIPIDPMQVEQVSWQHLESGSIVNDKVLIDAPPGEYEAIITDGAGCKIDTTFTLPYDIKTYNGISANNDGMNDVFIVDCIERYADNMVRIFDRDGNLVFEQASYNNLDRVFRGMGNAGTYIGQRVLPDGTYYYVINLGNGKPPITGFMELIH